MADRLGPEIDAIRRALAEDRVADDVTTRLLGAAAELPATGRFVAEGDFVLAGLPIAALVFEEIDRGACLDTQRPDGAEVGRGDVLATVSAPARTLLAGERVALNFLQRLSGVATLTRRAVDAVRGTACRITHTRKTTPGLRALELYAVRVGGGVDHRGSLAEAVLWKDNHWALLGARGGGGSLRDALATSPVGTPVVIEVEDERQLEEALAAGVTHILADNQPPERIAEWVRRAGPAILIEASGGITPESAAAYADAGAKLISMGSLTHSAPAAPISFAIAR